MLKKNEMQIVISRPGPPLRARRPMPSAICTARTTSATGTRWRRGSIPGVEWFHAGRHELVRGVEGVVAMLRSNAEAFPGARIDVRSLRAAGGAVIAEWTVVNARLSMTTDCEKPAIVCEVVEVGNGRIVRGATYGDILTMMMEFREEYRPPLRAVCSLPGQESRPVARFGSLDLTKDAVAPRCATRSKVRR